MMMAIPASVKDRGGAGQQSLAGRLTYVHSVHKLM
jgi:hypothetical protein